MNKEKYKDSFYEPRELTDLRDMIRGSAALYGLNDGTPELMAWMCDRFLKKDGSIQFLETKTLKVMKEIKFSGAYCVDFEEKWADKEGHYEEILISCQNIEVGSVKFENEWA